MAIVPKRKTSKQRKHKRRTHDALPIQNLISIAKTALIWFNNTVYVNTVAFTKVKKLKDIKV